MTTLAPSLPPPLTAPPSIATLQGLLDGLQQPMQRYVPSPPAVHAAAVGRDPATDGEVVDVPWLDGGAPRPDERAARPWGEAARPSVAPTVAAMPGPTPRAVLLTWSAGRTHTHPRHTAAVVTAVAAGVGVLTALAAAGELGLP